MTPPSGLRSLTALAALLVTVTSSACQPEQGDSGPDRSAVAAPSEDGPLDLGSSRGTVCLSGIDSDEFTFGVDLVRSPPATGEARIDAVGLESAQGLRLSESFLVRAGDALVGAWSQFPPPRRVTRPGVTSWEERTSAVGETVPAGTTSNLILHLQALEPGEESGLARVRVDYSSAGERYSELTPTTLEVRARC
jgi:hypothetical protein